MKTNKIILAIAALAILALSACNVNHGCEAYGQVDTVKQEARS